MKKGICIIFIFIALILVVNVLAYESTITINTGLPNHRIEFKPADPDTGKAITSLVETSDGSGEVVFNYNLEEMRIKLGFQAFKEGNANSVSFLNGKKAIFFSNVILDKFVEIDLNVQEPTIKVHSGEEVVEEVEEVVDTPEVVEEVKETIVEETEGIDQDPNPGITGNAIENIKDVATSTKTYYVLGGVILLVFIVIFIRKKMNKKGEIKVTKLSEINENKKKIEHTDDELDDAEKKIKEAKEELDEIRDKKKNLREAKEKFERDKEALKKLESDENTPK
jgi:hypothetical protein